MGFDLPLNPSEVSAAFPHLPEGNYRVKVGEGENAPVLSYTQPKAEGAKGKPYIKVVFELLSTEDGQEVALDPNTESEVAISGKSVTERLWLQSDKDPSGIMRRIKRFLLATGQSDDIDTIPLDEDGVTVTDWAGHECTISLAYGKPNAKGRRYLEVTDYVI